MVSFARELDDVDGGGFSSRLSSRSSFGTGYTSAFSLAPTPVFAPVQTPETPESTSNSSQQQWTAADTRAVNAVRGLAPAATVTAETRPEAAAKGADNAIGRINVIDPAIAALQKLQAPEQKDAAAGGGAGGGVTAMVKSLASVNPALVALAFVAPQLAPAIVGFEMAAAMGRGTLATFNQTSSEFTVRDNSSKGRGRDSDRSAGYVSSGPSPQTTSSGPAAMAPKPPAAGAGDIELAGASLGGIAALKMSENEVSKLSRKLDGLRDNADNVLDGAQASFDRHLGRSAPQIPTFYPA